MNLNKSQFSRLNELTELIRSGRQPINCLTFAAKWGVSQRTVQRDIDFLRDQMNAPLEYNRERKSFVFTQPTWSMPSMLVTKDVAGLVEEREWHAKQTLKKRKTGEVELNFPCKGLYEVQNWVLAWGHNVKVMEPKELRTMVRDEILLMAKGLR